MFRSILAVLALGVLIGIDAISVDVGPTCDVGEQERTGGLCKNGGDASKCNEYCQKKFGAELVSSSCSGERKNGKRECICKLKCCNSGCWGDPHCWTCDGVKFGYQGLKKYFVLKPITKYPTLPDFEITQINKPWQGGPMSILDVSELNVYEWEQVITLKVPNGPNGYILSVNDKKTDIPFRYSVLRDEYREHFISVVYGDAQKTQVVVTTSFGLRIVYTTKGTGAQVYSDISIDLPRHPELKDNSHGLLGRWNGNPADDSIDANGKQQKLDDQFSWAFGDSWIVPGGRTKTADCVREEAVKQKHKIEEEVDPKVKAAVEKLCVETLENPELKQCAKKLGRAVPMLKNCIIDLIFMKSEEARKQYIAQIVQSFRHTCKRRGISFKKHRIAIFVDIKKGRPHGDSSSSSSSSSEGDDNRPKKPHRPGKHHITVVEKPVVHVIEKVEKPQVVVKPVVHVIEKVQPAPVKPAAVVVQKPVVTVHKCTVQNLLPLYRLYKHATGDHFYTTSFEEATNAARHLGYVSEGSPGMVAATAQAGLQPVYRSYRPGARDDHFYTQSDPETANAAAKLGYKREGIAFYCPPANHCGASLAFHRYWRGPTPDHFYTTSLDEGKQNVLPHGGTYEGVLCHIWPNTGPVRTPK